MSLLAEFDPLVSPINDKQASVRSPPASATTSSTAVKMGQVKKKFEGVNLEFLYTSKWHNVNPSASPSNTYSLSFQAPTGPITSSQDDDPITKLQREKEEKERREREEKEERDRAELQRQEDAKAAAAAGKEAIPEDTNKVRLPSPKMDESLKLATPPVDPEIQKAQLELEALTTKHEKEEQERNRYVGKNTFRYASINNNLEQNSGVKMLEYQGVFVLKNLSIVLNEITKQIAKADAEPVKTDVSGSFTLTITADGKKISGKIENETIEFELLESDPTKALEQLLGF